jgi:hypothetical protein
MTIAASTNKPAINSALVLDLATKSHAHEQPRRQECNDRKRVGYLRVGKGFVSYLLWPAGVVMQRNNIAAASIIHEVGYCIP